MLEIKGIILGIFDECFWFEVINFVCMWWRRWWYVFIVWFWIYIMFVFLVSGNWFIGWKYLCEDLFIFKRFKCDRWSVDVIDEYGYFGRKGKG